MIEFIIAAVWFIIKVVAALIAYAMFSSLWSD